MSKRGKYGKWSQEDLEKALSAYKGGMGLNATSRTFRIPKATLKRHATNRNKYANGGKKSFGRPCILSPEYEQLLVNHILALENMLIGLTRKDLMIMAYQLAEKNGFGHQFNKDKKCASIKWYKNFMMRHPELSLRQAEATSSARARGFNKDNVNEFYDKLETILSENNITSERIYNMDESGLTTVQKPGRVIGRRGKKQIGAITSGERGVTTTIVCCMSASGHFVPPMVIFKRKRMIDDLKVGAPPGSIVVNNDSGWMTKELFLEWLKHFSSQVKWTKDNPGLLILDGHSSHTKNVAAIDYARAHGIIILSLPPHTTHRLQPLDRVFYKSLMTCFNQECDVWMRTQNTTVSIFSICKILGKAYLRSANMNTAINGFKCTGIWPSDRNVWNDIDFVAAERFEVADDSMVDESLQAEQVSDITQEECIVNQKKHELGIINQEQKDLVIVNREQEEPVIINQEPQELVFVDQEQKELVIVNVVNQIDAPPQSIALDKEVTQTGPNVPMSTNSRRNYDVVHTNPDGRCFFRAVVICQNKNLQNAQRDLSGSIVDTRLRLVELTSADKLRSNVVSFMVDNFVDNKLKNLEKELVNADLPISHSQYQSMEDRIANMANPKEYVGEIEIDATSKYLQVPIHIILEDNSTIKFGNGFHTTPIIIKYLKLCNDSGHYEAVLPIRYLGEDQSRPSIITPAMLSPITRIKVNKSKRRTSKSEIITSSPYRNSLVKGKPICRKNIENKGLKSKTTKKTIKRKLNYKQVGPESDQDDNSDNDPWYCPVCDEERQENMVRCQHCSTWIHLSCAGGIPPRYQCDLCQ